MELVEGWPCVTLFNCKLDQFPSTHDFTNTCVGGWQKPDKDRDPFQMKVANNCSIRCTVLCCSSHHVFFLCFGNYWFNEMHR
jgi:hypothetical protein